jgi:hypothetical protein
VRAASDGLPLFFSALSDTGPEVRRWYFQFSARGREGKQRRVLVGG